MNNSNELKKDLVKILKEFDMFLDNMWDRGAFDCCEPNDKRINDFVSEMKFKYL